MAYSRLDRIRAAERKFSLKFAVKPFEQMPPEWPYPDEPEAIRLTISRELATVLDEPLPLAKSGVFPELDAASMAWARAVRAMAATDRSHHFAARLPATKPDARDLAHLFSAAGAVTHLAELPTNLATVLLRTELHAGFCRPVVVVESGLLCSNGTEPDEDKREAPAPVLRLEISPSILTVFDNLRAVYVWGIPPDGLLPSDLDGIVAGCLGLLRYDRRAGAALIANEAPHLGPAAVAALHAMVADPRDARAALAATAVVSSANELSPDEAAFVVARSHGVSCPRSATSSAPFDPSLIVAAGAD